MKQVELWVEQSAFSKEIFYRFNHNLVSLPLAESVCDIIHAKTKEQTNNEHCLTEYLTENESRKTIIQALIDYQETLMPEGYVWNSEDFEYFHINIFDNKNKLAAKFYNKTTRIIKITSWEV